MPLYEMSTRDANEDVFRLKGVELVVTSDEQLAKARAKNAAINGSVQLKVTWEPMTYKKYIGDELVTEEVDYIKITKSAAVSDAALPLLREAGLRAMNKAMMVAIPNNILKADPDKQPQEYSRFQVAAVKAGLIIDPTPDGGVTCAQIGQLFRCRSGYEEFPTVNEGATGKDFWNWEDTRSTFMRVPLALVTDFVQPDELREFRYERKDTDDEAGTAGTTTTAAAAVTQEDVIAAVRAIGISGKPIAMLDANGLAIITSQVGTYRALATLVSEVQSTPLSEVLVSKGLATVEDGNLVVI